MSVLNQSGEELVECPLCMEPLEVDDLHFYPCTCGYQICRFCWNRIREGENGLCPACRKAYPENPADFTPLSQEQVAAIKTEKKAREQKRRNKTLESRRALANVRVVQNNLVFVVGLPVRLADPEILKRQEYFGKYGKIHKVVINQSTSYAGSQGPSASAYVTYVTPSDALRAIQGVNNVTLDGRVLKGSLGTTKYCANFMKNQPCPKPDCMYLHELGDPRASFTKEEMHAGLHQVYERKLHNQLLQSQKEKPDDRQTNGSGNSSTNAEKSSSKDGNQSNFIPTTVVTSSHINIVNSSKSNNKKEQNGNSNSSNGSSNSNGNGSTSNGNGKEAWPSLGSSPPSDSPARKQPSPQSSSVKSQENGMSSTSESSSPTLPTQAQIKHKETQQTDKNRTKESTTHSNKKNKKQKTNSISNDEEIKLDEYKDSEETTPVNNSVFDTQSYLTNELDELESDRHSLLENHDLLDNSDHSLLEDDTHNLLNDTNDVLIQRHREMLAGLDNNINNHLLPKGPILNGYGLLDREGYLDRQISQGIMDQKEMMIRHNVMVEPKHYIPSSSIGLESASELLGANYHQNPNMLPPFGMRVDNSMGNSITPNLSGNMSGNLSSNAIANNAFLLHNHQMLNQHQMQGGMVNGFDTAQAQTNEGRYLAENMDKFFTDFHKAQQMRLQLNRGSNDRYPHYPHNMLSAERLEMEHKQRLSNMRPGDAGGSRNVAGAGQRAAGDGDDDLDFDPFKETQKAFAELMETEMMHTQIPSGDNLHRRVPAAPPGFSHLPHTHAQPPAFALAPPPHAQPRTHNHHQGFVSNSPSVPVSASSAMFSDWSQMDPAIMSVNFTKQQQQLQQPTAAAAAAAAPSLTHQQQELFARFNQLGLNKPAGWAAHAHGAAARQLPWSAPHAQYAGIPLPPGFAPTKPQTQHKAECIDAK